MSTTPVQLPPRASRVPRVRTDRSMAQAALRGRVAVGAVVVGFAVALAAIAYAIDWV